MTIEQADQLIFDVILETDANVHPDSYPNYRIQEVLGAFAASVRAECAAGPWHTDLVNEPPPTDGKPFLARAISEKTKLSGLYIAYMCNNGMTIVARASATGDRVTVLAWAEIKPPEGSKE